MRLTAFHATRLAAPRPVSGQSGQRGRGANCHDRAHRPRRLCRPMATARRRRQGVRAGAVHQDHRDRNAHGHRCAVTTCALKRGWSADGNGPTVAFSRTRSAVKRVGCNALLGGSTSELATPHIWAKPRYLRTPFPNPTSRNTQAVCICLASNPNTKYRHWSGKCRPPQVTDRRL